MNIIGKTSIVMIVLIIIDIVILLMRKTDWYKTCSKCIKKNVDTIYDLLIVLTMSLIVVLIVCVPIYFSFLR